MTKFAGWIGPDLLTEQASAVLGKMIPADAALAMHFGAGFGLASASTAIVQEGGITLVAVHPWQAVSLQDLLSAYRSRGERFLQEYAHPLTLLIIDSIQQKLVLATDPIGISHIYYAVTPNSLVFGSSADFVVRHPSVDDGIDPQTVYDYVYFHHCPSPGTIYQHIKKLEGSQCLVYQNGRIEIVRYWMPQFAERLPQGVRKAGRALQEELVASVARMAQSSVDTGAFLSGGLDSSSVAGALSKVYPGEAKTFSIGFHVADYNEIEYADIASKHFKTRQHAYYVTPEDTVNAIPAIAAYYDEPFGNSSALAAYYCAKLAHGQGVTRLLAGDGGDEIFAGNERYALQMLFDAYRHVPGFVKTGLEAGLRHMPTLLARYRIPGKAKRYVEQANTGMPDRMQDYNFLHRHAATDVFEPDFLEKIDTASPLRQLREVYRLPENASTLNRMLYMDWKTTLHDNDLVKVNKMCEMVGVDVCYPLLDQSIVDLSCRIPSNCKLKGQKLRWFYKQAVADFLPERIINKSKHGFGLPFGIWLTEHEPLKALAYDAVTALKQRHFFNPQFLDHAIRMHQSLHAAYYGELIWILMMLELWFSGKKYR